jgi:uncharacterized membrane protein
VNVVTAGRILVILAFVVFVLATFGLSFSTIQLVPLGLAFYMAARIVGSNP